jgi:hypothetical protein
MSENTRVYKLIILLSINLENTKKYGGTWIK